MEQFFKSPEGKRIVKSIFVVLALVIAFLALKAVALVKEINYPNPPSNTISVSGTGEATSVPDIATFSFTVSKDSKNVADAQKSVNDKIADILPALKDMGIEDKDIKTTDYNVYPKYKYESAVCTSGYCPPGRQIADGYTVSQSVTVKVRKTEDAGKALGLVGEKGATNISGLSLTLDDPNAPMNEARLKAIENAKSKADILAKSLGVRIVRVTSYFENGGVQPMYAYDKVAMGMGGAEPAMQSASPVVPTGQNTVTSNVTVVFEIR
jgi:uncharacterized protein